MKLKHIISFLLFALLGTSSYVLLSKTPLFSTNTNNPEIKQIPISQTRYIPPTEDSMRVSKLFLAEQDSELFHEGGASIHIPECALDEDTEIHIIALRDMDLAQLPVGMVNVTANHKGFRFLPHGLEFLCDVEIRLPYDKSLIPQGYTEEDIRTFFYDEIAHQWVQLPFDTLNSELLAVISTTTHFTDMITGVIQVPESPETQGYTPTTLRDIKAADPSTGIVPIDPPQANNMGGASVNFPLKLPAGRAGMQPQLAIAYNSGAGNGWLGLGWDLSVPSIGIDLTFGSPRYSTTHETETYTLNGEQLFPLAHRGEPEARTTNKTFNPRIEGSFDRIIRHGNHPNNYWWEVTSKTGVRSFYGGTPSTGVINNAVLKCNNGNIAHWALVETRDANDNFVRYEYETREHRGVANTSASFGRQLYLSKIIYTGHGQTQGVYSVSFVSETGRPDIQIRGNLGFKQVTAELLKSVEVRYNNEIIRTYKLDYIEGAFLKTLLKSVAEYDSDGVLFYKNEFDYFDEVRSNGTTYVPYAAEETISANNDNLSGGFVVNIGDFNDKISLLGGSKSKSIGGGLYVGFGAGGNVASKNLTGGASYNYSRSTSEGMATLIDINGDGLPDKVFRRGGNLFYRPNLGGAMGFGDPVQITTISEFSLSVTNSHDVGASVFAGPVHVGYNRGFSDSKTSIYFMDFNGDGLVDIVQNGRVYFNRLVDGVPTFLTSSALTPAPVVGGGEVDPSLIPDFAEEQRELEKTFPLHDVVRTWQAPFSGTININAPVALIQDTSQEAREYTKKDGVKVSIQHGNTVRWSTRIDTTNYGLNFPYNVSGININKGERLYFRVQSIFDGMYDLVNWDPEIVYTHFVDTNLTLETTDFYGKPYNRYKASEDFILCGVQNIDMPFTGRIDLETSFKKNNTGDTIWLNANQVRGANDTVWRLRQMFLPDEIVSTNINTLNHPVDSGDVFSFRIESKNMVWWEGVNWQPKITYISASNATVTDEDGIPLIVLQPTVEYNLWQLHKAAKHLPVIILPERLDTVMPSVMRQLAFWRYVDTVRARPNDTLWAFRNDTIEFKIRPYIQTRSWQNVVENITMLVRGKEGSIYERKVLNLADSNASGFGRAIYNLPDSIVYAPKKGDSIWVEYYVNVTNHAILGLSDYQDFIKNLQAGIRIDNDSTLILPATVYVKHEKSDFGLDYRGWGQFAYNSNDGRADLPIQEHLLRPTVRQESNVDFDNLPENPDDLEVDDTPASGDIFITMFPDNENRRWVGYDFSTFVSADQISSSRMGEKDVKVEPYETTFLAGQLPAWDKKSKSTSNGFSAGISVSVVGLGGSWGNGESRNITDMLDLNGDGFPDLITESEIRYTDHTATFGNIRGSSFIHKSKSKSSGASSSGSIASSPTTNTSKFMTTKAKAGEETARTSISLSGSVGTNSDEAEQTFMDINGDGLPDKVFSDGTVALNLGHSFAEREQWGFNEIHSGSGTSLGAGLGVSLWHGSIQGGIGLSRSSNSSGERLIDVNGDGLPDWVHVTFNPQDPFRPTTTVRLNTGNGFAAPIPWADAYSTGQSVSKGHSANVGVTFGFTILFAKIVTSPSASTSIGVSHEKSGFMDFDGDGFPDVVYSESETEMRIKRSTIGKTNLLKTVHRPFSANFSLAYERKGNTYDQPHSQWVLSEVKLFDGFIGDGIDTTLTTFAYEGGFYNRDERSFFGYEKVTTNQHNLADNTIYRRVEQTYDNRSYYTKSLVLAETVLAGADTLSRVVNTYDLRNVNTGAVLPTDVRTYNNAMVFSALREVQKNHFEGSEKITTRESFGYDLLGNITTYTDFAAGNPADKVDVNITYHDINTPYLKAIPKSVLITTPEGLKRERHTNIDGKGNITQIRQRIDASGKQAIFDFEFDQFGNLKKVIRPANYRNQRMFFEYEYDPILNTFPTKVRDAFGYQSSRQYEYHFGMPTQTTDLNGNIINYTNDNRGRISTITAPDEIENGKPYTIKFEYFTDAQNPYTITYHAMPEGNEVLTYTFVDGLFRPLQVKKTGAIFDKEILDDKTVWIVSGWNILDGMGRAIETYHPTTENLGSETTINRTKNPIAPTTTTYDAKDRTLTVTLSDGAMTETVFEIGDIGDENGFITKQFDPLRRLAKSYTDAKGRQRAIVQVLNNEDIITHSRYNALGEVLEVKNTKGQITTYDYDWLGRRLWVNHPDAGLTEFFYDNANNLLKKITPNLRTLSQTDGTDFFIEYKYDFNRLAEIIYPRNVQNYVQYEYGAPNAPHNRAGRLILIQDASGGQEFFYDKLGNVTKEIRSILVSPSDLRTYVSQSQYDSWGRIQEMVYPDGEVVNYQYNLAGNLRSMNSRKDGRDYDIITQLGYDEYEQRVFKLQGNGTITTYTYEPERRRLATMFAGKGSNVLFDNRYEYDKVDNILSIENDADIPMIGLGGKTKNTYQYDEWNRLIYAEGTARTARNNNNYTLTMEYDKMYNIVNKNQQSNDEKLTHNFFYRYENPNRPNAPTQIGSKFYEYDANGNSIIVEDTATNDYRRMVWDEENRLMLLSDNGNGNNYIYDHAGERVIKSQTGMQNVFIDGLPVGMLENNKNITIYVSPNMVVKDGGFTKHYYAGTERVLSKLGAGEFNNSFSPTNPIITAGNKNYILRYSQIQKGIESHYKDLKIPPGNPTQKALLGLPETTGKPLPTTVGNYDIPRKNGWPREPIQAPPGGPPGAPIQFGPEITNDNVKAGYGYKSNSLEERDLYFYHPDHLGSTSIITDRNGMATQFIAYMPYGEALIDEHTVSRTMPFKFSGKEEDPETGLIFFGTRYYAPREVVWYGVDPLAERSPNVGGYVYCLGNPVVLVDPDGRIPWRALVANFSPDKTPNPPTTARTHPVHGDIRAHHGIDMPAPTGTDMQAAASGKVLFSGVKKGYGNTVVIDHGQGYYTLYAHMDQIGVEQGSPITDGQLIGTVGNTGTSKGSHLHVEYIKTDDVANIFGGDKNSARFSPLDVGDLQNIINNTELANVTFLDGRSEWIGGTQSSNQSFSQAPSLKRSQKLQNSSTPIVKTLGDILGIFGF
jgi:RHS repeat-associated protein